MANKTHPNAFSTDSLKSLIIKPQLWRKIIFLFSIAAIFYVIATNFDHIRQSIVALKQGNILLLLVALVAVVGTYFTAAGVYWALSNGELRYRQMLLVESAGAFTSRLLPAGIGGIATNLKYISKALGSKTAASAIVAFNNLLSFASYIVAALLMITLTRQSLSSALKINVPFISIWPVVIGLIVLIGLLLIPKVRIRARDSWQKLLTLLRGYRERPQQLIIGFLCALGTTLFYLTAFYVCCVALGSHLTLLQVFIAFTLGLSGGTVAPTPGGLGGAELGFYTGLYSAGISKADALSIVLVYRLISFWLPIVPGFFIFRYILKRKLL